MLRKIIPKPFKKYIKDQRNRFNVHGKQKIFCVGLNKTGTTSLKIAMNDLDYVVGNQRKAEAMIGDWANRDFNRLIKYCKTAQFFQDSPFSKPFTYQIIDQAYPNSLFILTIRDNAEQWYNSLTKFHAKKWGLNGRIPTKDDLLEAVYLEKGRPWYSNRLVFDTPDDDPYQKEALIAYYNRHNESVTEYFRFKPNQLLILNVSQKGAYHTLCSFINKQPLYDTFPWKNKTVEVNS